MADHLSSHETELWINLFLQIINDENKSLEVAQMDLNHC